MTRRGFVRCDRCDGLGKLRAGQDYCPQCGGAGQVPAPPRVNPEYRTLGKRID